MCSKNCCYRLSTFTSKLFVGHIMWVTARLWVVRFLLSEKKTIAFLTELHKYANIVWNSGARPFSCRTLPQQQQLHGLHPFSHRQQRLQSELLPERLRPAGAVQQAGSGEVHRRVPATRGRVRCGLEDSLLKDFETMLSLLNTNDVCVLLTFRLTSRHSWH